VAPVISARTPRARAGLAVISSVGVGRTAEEVGNLVVNREKALGLPGTVLHGSVGNCTDSPQALT
jgi:hypothetical protein